MADDMIKKPSSVIPSGLRLDRDKDREQQRHEGLNREGASATGHDEVKDHYRDIEIMVDRANIRLEEDRVPFRFRLHREGNDVIIDIIRIDGSGGIISVLNKNITHDSFMQRAQQILKGEGLFIDRVT